MMFVPTADPPQISTQPQDQIEAVGSATFTVQVSGKQPIAYSWECKLTGHSEYQVVSIQGTGVRGGDTNTLTIDDIRKDDEGDYRCLIYNSAGKVHSSDAKLILCKLDMTHLLLPFLYNSEVYVAYIYPLCDIWFPTAEAPEVTTQPQDDVGPVRCATVYHWDKFDVWKKRFTAWMAHEKLRVSDLFRKFDSNNDGVLTREEFMEGLKATRKYGGDVCKFDLQAFLFHLSKQDIGLYVLALFPLINRVIIIISRQFCCHVST